MKVPQWIYKKQHIVCHPSHTIMDVAKVLNMEASYYRKERNTEAARALKRAAYALREVAAGATYAKAFDYANQSIAAEHSPAKEKP